MQKVGKHHTNNVKNFMENNNEKVRGAMLTVPICFCLKKNLKRLFDPSSHPYIITLESRNKIIRGHKYLYIVWFRLLIKLYAWFSQKDNCNCCHVATYFEKNLARETGWICSVKVTAKWIDQRSLKNKYNKINDLWIIIKLQCLLLNKRSECIFFRLLYV